MTTRRAFGAKRLRPGAAAGGRRTSDVILDAATAMLADEGHAALTSRKIAARAGIRLSHLQYYYPTKQDVLRAIAERYLADTGGPADVPADAREPQALSAAARLDAAVADILAEHARSDRHIVRELWALAARDPAIDAAMRGYYARAWRRLVDLLLAAAPALRRPRAERRAALLVALLEGLTLFRSRATRALPLPSLEVEIRALAVVLATAPDAAASVSAPEPAP